MPILDFAPRSDGQSSGHSSVGPLFQATPTLVTYAESSSEAAALHGQKALTPIIAGTISGTCVGTAWLVALIVIISKHRRRRKRLQEAGRLDLLNEAPQEHPFILPPDPAVVSGDHEPGERIYHEKPEQPGKGKGKARAFFPSRHGSRTGSMSAQQSQVVENSLASRTQSANALSATAAGPTDRPSTETTDCSIDEKTSSESQLPRSLGPS